MDRRLRHYYYTGSGKNRQRHVRWTPAAGDLSQPSMISWCRHHSASNPRRLRAIEPFPTDGLIPYDPGYLAGWTVSVIRLI